MGLGGTQWGSADEALSKVPGGVAESLLSISYKRGP